MKGNVIKVLTATVLVACMLATVSTEASAWYCRANGEGGSGWGRSDSYHRAKHLALYNCYRYGSYCSITTCVR